MNNQQTIAVIGATGQIGSPLTKSLLELGHKVILLVRSYKHKKKLEYFRERNARIILIEDFYDVDELSCAIKNADTLVCAVPASDEIIKHSEPLWLKAAVKADIKRFVPTEFGCHTRGLDYGDGILFDKKKDFQEKLFKSKIGWTLVYNGLIYEYCLPNLRFFDKITTFGNMNLDIYTHNINDIGRFAALAVTDERTLNKCVQMDYQFLSQNKMLELLKKNFPKYSFEYQYYSEEFIVDSMKGAGDEVSAKKGAETDKERWGINNVIYVLGKLALFTNETLRATDLWKNFKLSQTAAEALADKKFVFENK